MAENQKSRPRLDQRSQAGCVFSLQPPFIHFLGSLCLPPVPHLLGLRIGTCWGDKSNGLLEDPGSQQVVG